MKFVILLFIGVAIVFELYTVKMFGKCHGTVVKSYDIYIEFVRPTKSSPHILDYRNLKIMRHNRTTNVISGRIIYNIDIDESVNINVRSYQKKNNEMEEAFLKFDNQTFCSIIEADTFIYPSLIEASNLPAKCPIKANTYTINNWIFDMKRLPSHIPGIYWLLVANTTRGDQLLSQMEIAARIEHKIASL